MAGLVTLPRRDVASLRHVEFLPLPGQRVLVILVVNEREVQNRVIHTEREYSESELLQAANFINREFAGQSLTRVRGALVDSMQQDKDHLDRLMQAALDVAAKAFDAEPDDPGNDFVMTGETNLISLSTESDMGAIRQLFDTFQRKRDVLHLLDRCLTGEGVQLFESIGVCSWCRRLPCRRLLLWRGRRWCIDGCIRRDEHFTIQGQGRRGAPQIRPAEVESVLFCDSPERAEIGRAHV